MLVHVGRKRKELPRESQVAVKTKNKQKAKGLRVGGHGIEKKEKKKKVLIEENDAKPIMGKEDVRRRK